MYSHEVATVVTTQLMEVAYLLNAICGLPWSPACPHSVKREILPVSNLHEVWYNLEPLSLPSILKSHQMSPVDPVIRVE